MYKSSRHEYETSVKISLPWDENTAKGFGFSLLITGIFMFLLSLISYNQPKPREMELNTVPLTILNLGDGDGTGISKGNLTKEGAKHKGKKPQTNIHDAEISSGNKSRNLKNSVDPEESSNIRGVSDIASKNKTDTSLGGRNREDIGYIDGTRGGTGLGSRGSGKGKGMGLGDIEWGGGGNRTVLYKKIPKYPNGVNTSAQIKLKFTVLSDGTVSSVVPLQKADPRLERAARDALKQWRFNPLKEDITMVGIIPLNFVLK